MININIKRTPDWVERRLKDFEAACRARGARLTAQRRAVFRALAEDPAHPTVEALHARLEPAWPSLPLPTVYRILEDLCRAGLARRVPAPSGPARFDANLDEHQHLVCRACGAMQDCCVPALTALAVPRGLPHDFVAEAVEVRLTGLCRRCAARETQARRPSGRKP